MLSLSLFLSLLSQKTDSGISFFCKILTLLSVTDGQALVVKNSELWQKHLFVALWILKQAAYSSACSELSKPVG
jgi:hypothetical protein